MIRKLHAARVESGNGKSLDFELLLNQIGGIFKPNEEAPENDESFQAVMSAQVRNTNYENKSAAAYTCPKRTSNQDYQNMNLPIS